MGQTDAVCLLLLTMKCIWAVTRVLDCSIVNGGWGSWADGAKQNKIGERCWSLQR